MFRDVEAYVRATALADEIHDAVGRWPAFEIRTTGVQLVRAIDSIGANIAEAVGREHTPDRRRFLVIARGSLYEAEHWLITAERRGLVAEGTAKRLEDVARPLAGLIKHHSPG